MAQSERANTRAGGRDPIDIWIGTTLGILKGASLSSKQCTNFLPGSLSLSQTDKSKEICVMCWEHQSQEKVLELIFAVNDCREEPLLLWDG